jgi:hypothetical protein
MRSRKWWCLAGVYLLLALTAPAVCGQAIRFTPDPITSYDVFRRHGFKVMLSQRLADGAECLQRLDDRLGLIIDAVPAVHLGILRGVTVWIEPGRDGRIAPSIIDKAGAFYVPLDAKTDLTLYGLRAETKGGIVVLADAYLRGESGKQATDLAPGFLLHEMAHAIHDRLLGYDDTSVITAYHQAMDRKLYDTVQTRSWDQFGQVRVDLRPAYARTNELVVRHSCIVESDSRSCGLARIPQPTRRSRWPRNTE